MYTNFITVLSILISLSVRSNGMTEQPIIPDQVNNSVEANCFLIIESLQQQTSKNALVQENAIQEQNVNLKSLQQQLEEIRIKNGVLEETIRNKDDFLKQTTKWYDGQTEAQKKQLEIKNNIIKDLEQELAAIQLGNKIDKETIKELKIIFKKEIDVISTKIISSINNNNQLKEYAIPSTSCIGLDTNIYHIKVFGLDAFPVPCDSTLAGSGWTVVQRRMDGSVNFARNWMDYVQGFGNLNTDFFIGLQKLHVLTRSQPHELYIYLKDFQNETRYARYTEFSIGNHHELFKIEKLGKYSGNAGDSLDYHRNMKFSTADKDNDNWANNCSKLLASGWWFNDCYQSDLNGEYITVDANKSKLGISWLGWDLKPLKFVQMMIRPKRN